MNYKVENTDNKFNDPKWLTKARIDLNCIPKMVELGFDVEMDYNDKRHDRTTVDNVPMNPVSFKKDNFVIWKAVDFHTNDIIFRTAYLVDGHYTGHKSYNDIDDVFADYCNKTE